MVISLKRLIVIALCLGSALPFFWGCTSIKVPSNRPLVIVSVAPYQGLVKAIGGNTFDVISALPSNYDPHTTAIAPSRIEALRRGSLWIGIGEPYEKKLKSALLSADPKLEVLQLKASLPLKNGDRHFWLSLIELRSQVKVITARLVRLWPEHQAIYQKNLEKLLSQIDTLNLSIKVKISKARGKTLLTSHDALSYFCRDYGLKQLALESHGKSPLPQTAQKVLSLAKNNRPLCAISFLHHPQKALSLIAKQLDLPTYPLDLLDPNPLKTIEELAAAIASALLDLEKKEVTYG